MQHSFSDSQSEIGPDASESLPESKTQRGVQNNISSSSLNNVDNQILFRLQQKFNMLLFLSSATRDGITKVREENIKKYQQVKNYFGDLRSAIESLEKDFDTKWGSHNKSVSAGSALTLTIMDKIGAQAKQALSDLNKMVCKDVDPTFDEIHAMEVNLETMTHEFEKKKKQTKSFIFHVNIPCCKKQKEYLQSCLHIGEMPPNASESRVEVVSSKSQTLLYVELRNTDKVCLDHYQDMLCVNTNGSYMDQHVTFEGEGMYRIRLKPNSLQYGHLDYNVNVATQCVGSGKLDIKRRWKFSFDVSTEPKQLLYACGNPWFSDTKQLHRLGTAGTDYSVSLLNEKYTGYGRAFVCDESKIHVFHPITHEKDGVCYLYRLASVPHKTSVGGVGIEMDLGLDTKSPKEALFSKSLHVEKYKSDLSWRAVGAFVSGIAQGITYTVTKEGKLHYLFRERNETFAISTIDRVSTKTHMTYDTVRNILHFPQASGGVTSLDWRNTRYGIKNKFEISTDLTTDQIVHGLAVAGNTLYVEYARVYAEYDLRAQKIVRTWQGIRENHGLAISRYAECLFTYSNHVVGAYRNN